MTPVTIAAAQILIARTNFIAAPLNRLVQTAVAAAHNAAGNGTWQLLLLKEPDVGFLNVEPEAF